MNLHVLNNCNHYGFHREPTCAKAVDIRAHVGGEDLGWMRRLPCVNSSLSRDVVACSLAEFPTKEARAENERQLMADLAVIDGGHCSDCGKALTVRVTDDVVLSACPDGHVVMRGCRRVGELETGE